MREFLTGLGILICLALIGAMVGPHFYDWNSRRALIEKRITQMTGLPARIDGNIAVTLLPTPAIALDQVKLGVADKAGFAPIEVERIAGALLPTALLRGEFVITEALIDAPKLRIGPEGLAGAVRRETLPPARAADPEAISIERLVIRDGYVDISRPGHAPLVLSSLSAELEATSLLGPARGNGSLVFEGARRSLRFSLGKIENGQGRLKLLVEDHGLLLRLDVDGTAEIGGPEPRLVGTMSLTGNPGLDVETRVQVPLRTTAKVTLTREKLALDEIALTAGAEPQPLNLTGSGRVSFAGDPRIDLTLTGRSFDFDRPGPDGKPRLAVPAELIRQAQMLAGGGGSGALMPDGRLDLSVGGLIIGGQTVTGARVVVERVGENVLLHTLEGQMPGQTTVSFARDALSDNGLVSGVLHVDSRDPERFNGWFYGVQRVVTAQAGLKASAVLSSVRGGVAIDRIEIDRGATHLSGEGSYLLAQPGLRPAPRLVLALQSPRFDIDDIPAFAYGSDKREEKPDLDFDVSLEALRLVLEGQETGRLALKARRDGDIISVERLEIAELDGANLVASGTLGGGSRRLTIKLDAARMDGLAAVAERVLPGAFTRSIRKRAPLISPALVVATLANDDAEESFSITAEGRLAATSLTVGGTFSGRNDLPLDLSMTLDNADGAMLARQIGAGRKEVHAPLPGAVRLTTKGNLRGALDVDLSLGLAGLSAKVDGQIRIFQPFSPFEGLLVADSSDLGPLANAMEFDPALGLTGAGLKLNGRVLSNLDQITITDLRATIGTMPVQGEIAFRIAENGKVAGQLRVPSVDFSALAGLVTGPGLAPVKEGRWSSAPFGKAFQPPLRGDLWIEAAQGRFDRLTFEPAKFVLRFDDQAISVEYADLRGAAARLTGDVLLRRNGAALALTSRLKWAGADLSRLWPEGPKGTSEGDVQMSARGDTPAKVAETLTGAGEVVLRNLVVPAHDPAALNRLLTPLAAAPSDAISLARRLEAELQRAPMAVPQTRSSLVLVDGVARLASVALDNQALRSEAAGTIDLARLALDLRLTSTARDLPAGWRGAMPQFTVQWLGSMSAPRRSLGVENLLNGILATNLQRDADIIDLQQQDARERMLFNRRLRASQQERQREEEAARAEALRVQNQQMRDLFDKSITGGPLPPPLNLLPDPAYPPAR